MRKIGMEDNNLALTFLIVSYLNTLNVLTYNKFQFQIITNIGE